MLSLWLFNQWICSDMGLQYFLFLTHIYLQFHAKMTVMEKVSELATQSVYILHNPSFYVLLLLRKTEQEICCCLLVVPCGNIMLQVFVCSSCSTVIRPLQSTELTQYYIVVSLSTVLLHFWWWWVWIFSSSLPFGEIHSLTRCSHDSLWCAGTC